MRKNFDWRRTDRAPPVAFGRVAKLRQVFSTLCVCGLISLTQQAAHAQTAPRIESLESKAPIAIETMSVGSQGMIGLIDLTTFRVAGYDVKGGPGRALAGQAADTIYLAVTSGNLTIDGTTADAGEIILIEPLMRGYQVQRYDAERLLLSLSEDARAGHPRVVSDLEKLASSQSMSIFFGRYVTTTFNAQNPGSPEAEEMRRQVVGAETIRGIRFSGAADPERVEELVVARFVDALRAGDAKSVADLLDPTPYGGGDLRGGDAARLLVAEDLVASRDWQRSLTGGPVWDEDQKVWRVPGRPDAVIQTRPVTDFVFIRTIE